MIMYECSTQLDDTNSFVQDVHCYKCSAAFRFRTLAEDAMPPAPKGLDFDALDQDDDDYYQYDFFLCVDCTRRLGEWDMYYCWHCGVTFHSYLRDAEGCSVECQWAIDEVVERAEERMYNLIEDRISRALDGPPEEDSTPVLYRSCMDVEMSWE